MAINVNDEIAGERVFGNVDEALAERIISRAKENSGEAGRACGFDAGAERVDKPRLRKVSIFKILVPVALVLIGLWVWFRRIKGQQIQ